MMTNHHEEYSMARKRIQLKQIRKILQLKHEAGLSIRDTAKLSGASKTTVSDYLARFNRSGIGYEQSKSLTDEQLIIVDPIVKTNKAKNLI